MTLTDTGPIVALLDDDDDHHITCLAAARTLPSGPMLTTWACFTEAMYLLGESGGFHFQVRLWNLRSTGRLQLLELTDAEADHTSALMGKYQNVPMDLADASLMAVAESRNVRRLFTIDDDFFVYRLANGSMLEIVR